MTLALAWAVLLSVTVLVTLIWPIVWVRIALVIVSVGWLLVNAPVEGDVLWTVSAAHGLTVADLFGFAGIAVAVLTQFSSRRPRRRFRGRR